MLLGVALLHIGLIIGNSKACRRISGYVNREGSRTELEMMNAAGMRPMDIIVAATRNGAVVMGQSE
jgi:hypothetical protein